MTATVDYYFAVVSPWSYLGDARLREIADRYGATLKHKPVNTALIFSRTGGLQLKDRSDQRKAYRMQELSRWRDHLGVELTLEPRYFPTNDQLAARTVAAVRQSGEDPSELVHALMRACWVEDRDVAEASVVKSVLDTVGLESETLLVRAESEECQNEVETNTEEAISRGVFGVPTYLIGDQLFWGQDRLDFVERALAR
ncbi:MAG: 2-hydroxychromene-2-carboxylate isomerase [Pseudomonadota bacterium]|nr:2-hydroxychromene-2-carboxylate isomerase [Pseudomonadota bacterium]MEE3287441.1 2-hydroxychromene-2-carboxylate isomerase [Pseudomonadota bacterium]